MATRCRPSSPTPPIRPCGLCIDSKGRKIGWKVKAARIIYDRDNASVTLGQPSLELLGIPVAWLPWFWVPDPDASRAPRACACPRSAATRKRGVALTVPYFVPAGDDIDIILSPTLMSRQGLLMLGDVNWRLPAISARSTSRLRRSTSSIPAAYAGTSATATGAAPSRPPAHFTPADELDRRLVVFGVHRRPVSGRLRSSPTPTCSPTSSTRTYLTDDTWFDARVQSLPPARQFHDRADDDEAGAGRCPSSATTTCRTSRPAAAGCTSRASCSTSTRAADDTATYNGVPYVFGYAGQQAAPDARGRLGEPVHPARRRRRDALSRRPARRAELRCAAARYAVPLYGAARRYAALERHPDRRDRFALAADGAAMAATRICSSPSRSWSIAARSTTCVGITNDDAQSFVFDDTNLFSYNRFSGIDRQETGLRANLGGHYLGNFGDGSWLDLSPASRSSLPGSTRSASPTRRRPEPTPGLGSTASYIVAGRPRRLRQRR